MIILPTKIMSQGEVVAKKQSDEKSRYKHGKPVNVPHHSHSNSDTDSDNKLGGTTDASTKHHVYNEDLAPFYQTTVSSLQNKHFRSNVIKFVLGYITNLILSLKKLKTIRWMKLHHHQNWNCTHVFLSMFSLRK